MSNLEPLIADLALILICAGVMTLLFKRLKQPIVLGYIVAGFLASPNMSYMPSVTDMHGIHMWSEIGVIFLLFALGRRSVHGSSVRMERDGLHLLRRYAGDVVNNHYLQGFRRYGTAKRTLCGTRP